MVDRSLLQKLIWLRGSPASGGTGIEKTAGPADIVTVTDALKKPLVACEIGIEPVQDLHGYENPWPAGGGKNLLNSSVTSGTVNNIVVTANSDGTFTLNGTADAQTDIIIDAFTPESDKTYTLSGISGGSSSTYFLFVLGYTATRVYNNSKTFEGSIFVDTDPKNVAVRIYSGQSVNVTVKPMLEYGSSASSYAPYANICPISGWTGATLTRTGKNLFRAVDGTYTNSAYSAIDISDGICTLKNTSNYPIGIYNVMVREGVVAVLGEERFLNPGSYTFTLDIISFDGPTSVSNPRILIADTVNGTETTYASGASFTCTHRSEINLLPCTVSGGFPVGASITYRVQIEIGSTASDYSPYSGATYPVTWQDEAGTVYGGTVDLVTGVLTVEYAMVDLGTLAFSLWNSNANRDCFSHTFSDILNVSSASENIDAISSVFKATNYNATWAPWQMSFTNTQNQVVFTTPHEEYATPDDFATAMDGVQFLYKLATPQTIQLSETQVIQLLKGTNNLWADTGETEITYIAKA